MLGRRLLFGLSVCTAAALYALLFALAPRIEMLQAGVRPERIMTRFNIVLRDPDQILQRNDPGDRQAFTARPGSVRDLLKMNETPVAPTAFDAGIAPIPDLAQRIARDTVQNPPVPMDDSLQRVDAKILEITRQAARREVEVPRRLVRPSPSADTDVEGLPVLREPNVEDTAPQTILPPSGLPSLLAAGPGILADAQQGAPVPYGASEPLVQLEPVPALLVPPLDAPTSRAPIHRAVEDAKQARDFGFLDDLLDIELATWRSPGDSEGYFQLRILPKEGESIPILSKDVTFVIDASSSIPQHKLDGTIKGLRAALQYLRADDRFNVVTFRESAQAFQPDVVPATKENLAGAREFLKGLQSQGETDVYKALQPVVKQDPRDGMAGVVVVVSDGRPTTGIQDGRIIINGLTADNAHGNGIYAFGGGRTVNRYLLDLLAYRNKGAAEVAPTIESIESELPRFFATLRDPILVGLKADFGRIDESTVYPQVLPDFFKGQAVTLYGRFQPGETDEFTLWLGGRAGERKKEVVFRAEFQDADPGTRDIARGWAFQKAYYIIGRISREGETPELLGELKRLRAEFGVRTSYDQ